MASITTSSPHSGVVRRLLDSNHVTSATRGALLSRQDEDGGGAPQCFSPDENETVRAVCARLVPQDGRERPVPLPALLDADLAKGDGDGWRYDAMPPDQDAIRQGLRALAALSRRRNGVTFSALAGDQQDSLLASVQQGECEGWDGPQPERFFEELLSRLAALYYARPAAIEEIGYVGFADAHGFAALGLDQRDPVELSST